MNAPELRSVVEEDVDVVSLEWVMLLADWMPLISEPVEASPLGTCTKIAGLESRVSS